MPHASWLVIEFCAPVESSMRAASQDLNWVNVLTVSERDDGASTQTLLELKAIFAVQIKKKGFVFLWASTPCTGGCPYQRLRARDPAYRRGRLAQHWRLHRKLWKSLVELTSFVHAWAIEWPRACAYWSWRQTEHFLSSRPYVLHDVPVDGCALDMRGRDHLLIAKRWRVVTTHPAVAESIRVYRCSGKHEHSKDFDLKSTQHYPVELVKSFFEALTFKMSLVPFAAERAMVFGLVVEVQEKLLEVPSVGLLVVVLVPLLVGVALGVCLQKLRTESSRVKTVQDLLSFLPRSGQKMAVFTSAYGDCFHVRRDCHGLRNALPNRIAAKVACEYCLRDLHLVPPTATASWGGVENQCSAQ
ncbi:GIP [Symbiodinium sp. CCMP2592]|nr:GIP [Symbiodinium sp. CCMP2592]